MTQHESADLVIATLAVLLNLGALVFLGLQIRHAVVTAAQANQNRLDEWAQKRRESTLQFYMSTIERRESYKTALPPDRDSAAITRLIADSRSDQDKDHAIRIYLNYFEMVATGVNSEVLDIEVMDDFAGSSIVAAWNNYLPWIEDQRTRFDAPTLSCEFQKLAEEMARRRGLGYQVPTDADTAGETV